MADEIEVVLTARSSELPGGLHVLRALPQAQRRMVGPFIFLDQMGPIEGATTVLPHPHIGLSTVTYLFEGELVHRDTLGTVQRIVPGDVNWMTAGRGLAHSERGEPRRMSGIQIWVALPQAYEETAPTFDHHPAATLPIIEQGGASLRVIAGALEGVVSPVKTHSPLFYAVATLEPGAVVRLGAEHVERAAYVTSGKVTLSEGTLARGELAVFRRGAEVLLRSDDGAQVLLFGGEPLESPRHIWWNFVASSKARIEQAKADWQAQRFGTIAGETEHIPLPGR